MIRVTVELVSAIHPSRSKVLGTMEICNDGTGTHGLGHYTGKLHAEYTGKAGRPGEVRDFHRSQQSVWTLIGAFLKLWGHTRHKVGPMPKVETLEPPPINLDEF